MEYHIVYAKFDGCKSFKAFDVNEGRQVGNLIYASLVENTEDTRSKLQKLADMNKSCNLILQLRRNGKVKFQQPSAHNLYSHGYSRQKEGADKGSD